MIIYKVTNRIDGKIYIGKTTCSIERRKSRHYSQIVDDSYFHRALNKYDKDNFTWETIEECQTEEHLSEREQFWIKELKSYIPTIGYNSTMGGEGSIPNEETRKKLSTSRKGRIVSPETRLKISKSHKELNLTGENSPMFGKPGTMLGRKHSEETKKKISNALRGKIRSKEFKEKQSKGKKEYYKTHTHHSLGTHLPEETRQKISKSNKGQRKSEETKRKISQAQIGKHRGINSPSYGKKHSKESIEKMSEVRKRYWKERKEQSVPLVA